MSLEAPFPTGPDPRPEVVADWVEFQALARRSSFKRGDLKSALASEDLRDPDLIEQLVWTELVRRSEMFGDLWPLRLGGPRLSRRSPVPGSLAAYRFLCCLGMGLIDAEDRGYFELLVAELLSDLSGHRSMHIGAPASSGMPTSFRERVTLYADAAGFLPEQRLSSPLPDDKDLGVDAVTWKPFRDGRSGYLHFLAQCATGEDWKTKFDDLRLSNWELHLVWGVPPVRVFAVPFTIMVKNNVKWLRTCAAAGLVLDRPRLVEIASRVPLSSALERTLRRRVEQLAVV